MIYNSIDHVQVPLATNRLRKNNFADFSITTYINTEKKILDVCFNKQLGMLMVVVKDGRKHIATLSLFYPSHYPEMIPAYAVSTMGIIPEYQGFGIGQALYSGLIRYHDISLLSSNVSLGARKMWHKLCREKSISTYVYDQYVERYYDLILEKSLDFSFIDYDGIKKSAYTHSEQYAIIATKKKGQHDRIAQRKMKVDKEQEMFFSRMYEAFEPCRDESHAR